MFRTNLKYASLVGLFMMALASCAPQLSQTQVLIASGGAWPGGWIADGSQLLIYTVSNELYVISTDDSSFPRIKNLWDFSRAAEGSAWWSPDGMSILFEMEKDNNECIGVSPPCTNLYRLDAPGNDPTLILSSISLSDPAWSPNSQQFAVIVNGILRLYDRDSHQYRELVLDFGQAHDLAPGGGLIPVDNVATDLAWSPDGKIIAFGDFTHTYLVDVGTGRPVASSGFPQRCIQPTWSPDGRHIACIENALRSQGNLVIVGLNGEEKIKLAGVQDLSAQGFNSDEFLYTEPLWSPRGDYIAVRRIRAEIHNFNDSQYYEVVLILAPDLK